MDELNLGLASVRVDTDGDHTVVHLCGELDVSCTSAVRAALDDAFAGDDPGGVVFDLTDLRFMDSSGIALLLGVSEAHGPVELRHPSAVVRRIVEATGLAGVLRMAP